MDNPETFNLSQKTLPNLSSLVTKLGRRPFAEGFSHTVATVDVVFCFRPKTGATVGEYADQPFRRRLP
ncbi:MAG: hypothetical protein LBP87_12625 [Planctomycetaceae bacterium]|nr:hypothetical protein [Planctomycetaceae bacterium]